MSSSFILSAGAASLTLSDETRWSQGGIERRLAEYHTPGANGVTWLDLGDGTQQGQLSGWLHAASGAALQTLMDEVDSWRGTAFTLRIRADGESEDAEWENCVLWGAPQFPRRLPDQLDGTAHVSFVLTVRRACDAAPA